MTAEIDKTSWPVLPIFEYLKSAGNIDPEDIYSAFNMGIGYILVVTKDDVDGVVNSLGKMGEKAYVIGSIKKGDKTVKLVN